MNTDTGHESFIVFEVAGTAYGIRSSYVQQLEMIENITPVPNTPAYIEGLMFSRGQVIPVINLRLRFGLGRKEFDVRTRIIVVRYQERIAGLLADSAREYLNIPEGSVQPSPEYMKNRTGSYIEGIAKTGERIILIFNIPELLSINETQLNTTNH
jgi:purine-binding chemotaxis protein CheW